MLEASVFGLAPRLNIEGAARGAGIAVDLNFGSDDAFSIAGLKLYSSYSGKSSSFCLLLLRVFCLIVKSLLTERDLEYSDTTEGALLYSDTIDLASL
jgi:hypothetical protein